MANVALVKIYAYKQKRFLINIGMKIIRRLYSIQNFPYASFYIYLNWRKSEESFYSTKKKHYLIIFSIAKELIVKHFSTSCKLFSAVIYKRTNIRTMYFLFFLIGHKTA